MRQQQQDRHGVYAVALLHRNFIGLHKQDRTNGKSEGERTAKDTDPEGIRFIFKQKYVRTGQSFCAAPTY